MGRKRKMAPAGDQGTTKVDMVRDALRSMGGNPGPLEIQLFARQKYGTELDKNMISSYKSAIKREAGKSGMRRVSAGNSVSRAPRPSSTASGLRVEDVQKLKDLTQRIGAEQIHDLVTVLSR